VGPYDRRAGDLDPCVCQRFLDHTPRSTRLGSIYGGFPRVPRDFLSKEGKPDPYAPPATGRGTGP